LSCSFATALGGAILRAHQWIHCPEYLKMTALTTVECPICCGGVDVGPDVMLAELLDCGDCGSELEVIALSPTFQLAEAPMSAEDWGE